MKYDLTHVDPHRRPEVLRRIRAIERYNADPGRDRAETEAASIGLSASAFYTLVKAWNKFRDPTRIPGTRRKRRGSGIEQDALALIRATNDDLESANFADVILEVRQRAMKRGIKLPHDNTIREAIRRLRRGNIPHLPEGVTHVLDQCCLNVPVNSCGMDAACGVLVAVIDVRRAAIVGAQLTTTRFDARDAAVAIALPRARNLLKRGDTLLIDRPATDRWDHLVDALAGEGIIVAGERIAVEDAQRDTGLLRKRGNGRSILAACGRYVAGFQVRTGVERSSARLKKNAEPMSLPAAQTLILGRLLGEGVTEA
ncbi:MAG: hypothetical protein GW768_07580 [Sphingomonadales bacterium]|nr:hypothetical protein [Sphingomonadales bacterium]NCT03798.1 hypothetical protein [Sphingomonadales bacterium]